LVLIDNIEKSLFIILIGSLIRKQEIARVKIGSINLLPSICYFLKIIKITNPKKTPKDKIKSVLVLIRLAFKRSECDFF
jgi:hypothetical protein